MSKLHDIIAYFCIHTESKSDLSKARLTKLVYLADWFSAQETGQPMTNIRWVFNHYGPYVNDVVDFARNHPDFVVTSTYNEYGSYKEQIDLSDSYNEPHINLLPDEERRLARILHETSPLYFNAFIDYVYSTYPVTHSNRYDSLDLARLASEQRLDTHFL